MAFNFKTFKKQMREIASLDERKQQEEARVKIWSDIRKKGTYSLVVKTVDHNPKYGPMGVHDTVVMEICARDPLHDIKRKLACFQSRNYGRKFRLTCGCWLIPQEEWPVVGITHPPSYYRLSRPYDYHCEAEGCIQRASLAKKLNLMVTFEQGQLSSSFQHSAEKKVKDEMRRAGPVVKAYMCYSHFLENYKRDCPNCAHAFIPQFRNEI